MDDRGSLCLHLPEFSLVQILPDVPDEAQPNSFVLFDTAHALRHASHLLRILIATIVPEQQLGQTTHSGQRSASFDKHLPWLMDSLESLNEEQKRWKDLCAYSPVPLLEEALRLADAVPGVDHILAHKLDVITVLISADVAEQTNESADEAQHPNSPSKTLALALVHLAHASIKRRPIAKLTAAQLLKKLDWLITDGLIQDGGDLKVRSLCNDLNRTEATDIFCSARCFCSKELLSHRSILNLTQIYRPSHFLIMRFGPRSGRWKASRRQILMSKR